jgi:phosphatidylserine decarboxylase
MRIVRDGIKFALPSLAVALIFLAVGWWPLFLLFLLLLAAFVYFFRDPERRPPDGEGKLVAPADGRVLGVTELSSPAHLSGRITRVTIFLSLLDVHVTRAPVAGTVRQVDYRPGKFLPAYRPEAGEQNESCSVDIRGGPADVFLRQVVGVAARRIKCFVRSDEHVIRGQRIGLMYFGSRVEVDLPPAAEVRVQVKEKVRAGETIIAEVKT